jgi:UTP--glucose-1-phosphate uridylyltransferase
LEDYLSESGKEEQLERVKRIADMANFIYVRQKGPYGNGTPCLNSEAIIGDEPFIYAFGDDLVLAEKSFTKSLVEEYEKKPGIYFGVQEVPEKEVVRYGIAQLKEDGEPNEVEHFVEKPSVDQAPSNLAGFGRYVLEPGIFEALKGIPRGKDGELWLVDAVEYLLKEGHKAYVKKIEDGRWYTTGDPVRYFEALRVFALNHLEYGSQVKHIFK